MSSIKNYFLHQSNNLPFACKNLSLEILSKKVYLKVKFSKLLET